MPQLLKLLAFLMGKRPQRGKVKCPPVAVATASLAQRVRLLGADISGSDDQGRGFANLAELWLLQGQQREKFYRTNRAWWVEGSEHFLCSGQIRICREYDSILWLNIVYNM